MVPFSHHVEAVLFLDVGEVLGEGIGVDDVGRLDASNLGKTNPLNDADLAEFVELQKPHADSPKSWTVNAQTIDPATFDLSVKNPNGGEEVAHRTPQEIMDEIAALDAESTKVLESIRGLL